MMVKNTGSPGSFADDDPGAQGRLFPAFQHCDNHAGSLCPKANCGHLPFWRLSLCVQSHSSIQVQACASDLLAGGGRVWKTKFGLYSALPHLGKLRALTHMYIAVLVSEPWRPNILAPHTYFHILFYILFLKIFLGGGQSLSVAQVGLKLLTILQPSCPKLLR